MPLTDLLHDLQVMRDKELISPSEAASRARAILDREGMKPIDLAAFLHAKGYEGDRLLSAVGSFGRAVKAAYIEDYGTPPMRVETILNGEKRIVNGYLELDRDLIERVFEDWA